MKAYHVDTRNKISDKIKNIELQQIPKTWKNYDLLQSRYTGGLSEWGLTIMGIQYQCESKVINLTNKNSNNPEYHWNSYLIDVLYEYERLASFPDMPSRFQSIFASKTLAEAESWKELLRIPNSKIYELEFSHENYTQVDSNFLKCQINRFDLSSIQNSAAMYWSGEMKKQKFSLPELIIKLPVQLSPQLKAPEEHWDLFGNFIENLIQFLM